MLFYWISPFFYFLSNLRKYKHPYFQKVLFFVCLFFCLTFVIPNEYADADSYRSYLIKFNSSNQSFLSFFNGIYEEFTDPLMPIITFLISRFTNDYHILFFFYGTIYSFFYVKFYSRLIKYFNVSDNILLLVLLLFIVPIWQINGFRMWTATYAMIYAVFLIYEKSFIRSTLILIFATLMHVALIPYLLIILFFIFRNFITLKVLFPVYFLTFFLEQVNLTDNLNLQIFPEIFNKRIEGYSSSEYIQELSQAKLSTNFYVKYKIEILFYPLFLVLTYLYKNINLKLIGNVDLIKLNTFILIITNLILTLNLGAVERFYNILNLFMGLSVLYLLQFKKLPKFLNYFFKSAILLYLLIELRFGFDYISFDFFISNPIFAFFYNSELPLNEIINLLR